jgi:hypothetical protein
MLPRTVHWDEQDEYEVIQHDYPDSMQLGSILGTPDKPGLHILAETLGDAEGVLETKIEQTEPLPGFERLHEHEEGDTTWRGRRYRLENENRLRSNGVDFFREESTYGLLVEDHGKLIPTQ